MTFDEQVMLSEIGKGRAAFAWSRPHARVLSLEGQRDLRTRLQPCKSDRHRDSNKRPIERSCAREHE